MALTLAFDIYGTLIDTQGVNKKLEAFVGEKAAELSSLWRSKQLEYSFRRGLMRDYQDFEICTRQALQFGLQAFKIELHEPQIESLMQTYRVLPAFDDVVPCLELATSLGIRLVAFSNGSARAVNELLEHAGIRTYFSEVVSVEALQTFKPNPDVYNYLLTRSQSTAAETWLVSGNPFDILGAANADLKTAWIKRQQDAVFDPWGVTPIIELEGLERLPVSVRDRL